jgi:hypothetical protein
LWEEKDSQIKKLEEKLLRYNEALKFYADKNSYNYFTYSNDIRGQIENEIYIIKEGGKRAREALKD